MMLGPGFLTIAWWPDKFKDIGPHVMREVSVHDKYEIPTGIAEAVDICSPQTQLSSPRPQLLQISQSSDHERLNQLCCTRYTDIRY